MTDPLPDFDVLRVEVHDIRPDDRLALIFEDDLDPDVADDLADALAAWAGLDLERVVVIGRGELARIRPVEEPEP